jgi:hypothetical protein
MMAPIGSFSNYKRGARALLVLNHGFESLGAGRYRATVRHSQGGTHELVLSGVQPRFAQCLPLALPQVPDAQAERLAARPQARLLGVAAQPDSDTLAVDVQLEDRATREAIAAVPDLMLLAFDKYSGWQRRTRLIEQAPGRYRATLPNAPPGQPIELLVSSASQDLPFGGSLIGRYERPAP